MKPATLSKAATNAPLYRNYVRNTAPQGSDRYLCALNDDPTFSAWFLRNSSEVVGWIHAGLDFTRMGVPVVSLFLDYIYLEPDSRDHGLSTTFAQLVGRELSSQFISSHEPPTLDDGMAPALCVTTSATLMTEKSINCVRAFTYGFTDEIERNSSYFIVQSDLQLSGPFSE